MAYIYHSVIFCLDLKKKEKFSIRISVSMYDSYSLINEMLQYYTVCSVSRKLRYANDPRMKKKTTPRTNYAKYEPMCDICLFVSIIHQPRGDSTIANDTILLKATLRYWQCEKEQY